MINVTKAFFPPLEDYQLQIQRIWKNQWLTNRGELVLELEEKLKEYLSVDNIIMMTNGTIPLQIALKILGKKGEIITTPFSYIATTSTIIWENCTPVFVDIHPEYLTLDETKIEAAITDKTTCILATHVFGNPCHVETIAEIAKKYNLKVIYDAAHAFGVTYNGETIFNYGDISTCSFHATKIFHTGEGGALFCTDDALRKTMFYSHNFGHDGALNYFGLGINGKASELQAAMGLTVLPFIPNIFQDRKRIVEYYDDNLDFVRLNRLKIRESTQWNYSYYPIILESEAILIAIQVELNKNKIFPRRYFYPSLNTLSFVKSNVMPISERIASRILCLPLYVGLEVQDLKNIVNIINQNL